MNKDKTRFPRIKPEIRYKKSRKYSINIKTLKNLEQQSIRDKAIEKAYGDKQPTVH